MSHMGRACRITAKLGSPPRSENPDLGHPYPVFLCLEDFSGLKTTAPSVRLEERITAQADCIGENNYGW
jgi:hypothetical protein